MDGASGTAHAPSGFCEVRSSFFFSHVRSKVWQYMYELVRWVVLCNSIAMQKSAWLESLKRHLDTHVMPVATSHGIDITSKTLHESVMSALRLPATADLTHQPSKLLQ